MYFTVSLLAFRLQFLNKLELSGDLTAPCLPLSLIFKNKSATSRLLFRRRGTIPLFLLHHPPPLLAISRQWVTLTFDLAFRSASESLSETLS